MAKQKVSLRQKFSIAQSELVAAQVSGKAKEVQAATAAVEKAKAVLQKEFEKEVQARQAATKKAEQPKTEQNKQEQPDA